MIKLKDILQEQSDVVGTGLSNFSKREKSKITDLFIGQARPEFDSNNILKNMQTGLEKGLSKILTSLGAIDIEVTRNMSTDDVVNKIKILAVKGLLVPGQLNSITISTHNTGCGKFNYDIHSTDGPAGKFWKLLAKFCNSNTKIFLGGCSVASDPKTVANIAKVTNCTVTAPAGLYAPATGMVDPFPMKDTSKYNLSRRIGKYLTCTNNPTGDAGKYNKFLAAHFSDLLEGDPLSVGRMMSIIKDFRDDLNYISAESYEKLSQNQTNQKLISTIIEQFTIRLIKDYIKALGCYASKENPIQGTRQAIFK